MNEEVWKDVVGSEGFYQVSSHGRVQSVERLIVTSNGRSWLQPGKMLAIDDNHNGGYLTVMLSVRGKAKRHLLHRLVATAFIPNPLDLPEVNHSDGDKKNCRAGNLEWATRQRNIDHAVENAMINNKGENNQRAVLSEATVLRIRELAEQGLSNRQIAAKTGATKRNVQNITSRTSWKHVA